MEAKLIFISGTNTGTGKTLLTCLALHHLRSLKKEARGLKPFCSGSRSDAHHICFHNQNTLHLDEVNPWFFSQPLSPGAMPENLRIKKEPVIKNIRKHQGKCEFLLVEGAGGLLSPLGSNYHFGNLVRHFNPSIIVAAPNQLGVLNQVLLTHDYLRRANRTEKLKIVLMGQRNPDLSADSNADILRKWIPECPVIELPYLGTRAKSRSSVITNAQKLKRKLDSVFLT